MVANQIDLPVNRQRSLLSPRTLGTLGMIAAPMMAVDGLYHYFWHISREESTPIIGTIGIIYIAGWMCSSIAMRWLDVTGTGTWNTIAFVVQMIGLTLAGTLSLHELVHFDSLADTTFLGITDAAWPLSHLFMLATAGFVAKAGVWKGWRRAAPFVCGLALPPLFASFAIGVPAVGFVLFPVITTTGFLMLGYAVRTSEAL